jgi:hypothetical protein
VGSSKAQANCKQENSQGKNDQPSSSVLGVYSTCEKAEQAYKETTFAESREFADFYGESYMEKTDVGILITNSSDDSYWTLVRLHESEML